MLDRFELLEEIAKAKFDLDSRKHNVKTLQEEQERIYKTKHLLEMSGTYDPEEFDKKAIVDKRVFQQIVKEVVEKPTDDILDKLEEVWDNLYKTIRVFYESVNLEPRTIVPKDLLTKPLFEQEESIKDWLTHVLDALYYDKTVDQRIQELKEEVKEKLPEVSKNINEDTKQIIRGIILTRVLEQVVFPPFVKSTIDYIIEDEVCNSIFDTERIQEAYEKIHTTLERIANTLLALNK